ncbi:MAG: polysaccharide deacetylase family protein [Akkermansiaceae bacterium]
MKISKLISLITIMLSYTSLAHWGDDIMLASTGAQEVTELDPENMTRVSVLGYHDFSATKPATEMLIQAGTFRKQMQTLKDLNLKVISMADFIAWKRGEKEIADKSIVITIDDGWKSVYTEAYPVLKEFGYPFTVFLYSNYVDGGGAALTTEMIQEMKKHGCTIGSHSISHPYPAKVRAERAKGAESFSAYLQKEIGESKNILETKFNTKINSYAYPGGFVTEEMLAVAEKNKYDCLFTVLPGKVDLSTPNFKIPRYIILGTHEYIFRNATSFEVSADGKEIDAKLIQKTPHPVSPAPGVTISNRLPIISADLSGIENLDSNSIIMRIAGYGKVPASYDEDKKTISWKVSRRLRASTCIVSVQWKTIGDTQYADAMTWLFRIDRKAAYQVIDHTH